MDKNNIHEQEQAPGLMIESFMLESQYEMILLSYKQSKARVKTIMGQIRDYINQNSTEKDTLYEYLVPYLNGMFKIHANNIMYAVKTYGHIKKEVNLFEFLPELENLVNIRNAEVQNLAWQKYRLEQMRRSKFASSFN